nr:XdhC family protein [Flexivirga meconopsidis]
MLEHCRSERSGPVLATVVSTSRSAPRPAGTSMVVLPDGSVTGSISNGCLDADVYETACETRTSGIPTTKRYGVSDDPFGVGLSCGGSVEVFVRRLGSRDLPWLTAAAEAVADGRAFAVATVVAAPDRTRIGDTVLVGPAPEVCDDRVTRSARALLASGTSGTMRLPDSGGCRTVFVQSVAPPPRMIIFGSGDYAIALSRQSALLGYAVTICDARPVFADAARLPDAGDVIVQWPHTYLAAEAAAGRVDGRTAVAVLTHDPKFDVPVLRVALGLPEVGYIGVLGSRRTHEDRLERLRDAGVPPEQLDRMCSPIGLDLGGVTPAELAVSVTAEMIALRTGASGARLSQLPGPIHRASATG